MAAQRIRAATANGLPRCKSEGTLIDVSEGLSESSFEDVKVPSPSALLADSPTPFGNAKEVVAIRDYCPTNFTTLKFSKGDHLYVLDASGGEWWYAHNTTEMGYIPAAYVQPLDPRLSTLSDSGVIDPAADSPDEAARELEPPGGWPEERGRSRPASNNPFWPGLQTNPFLNGHGPAAPASAGDLLLFEPGEAAGRPDNPFFRSKRSYSLSELSVLQARADAPAAAGGLSAGLQSPAPEQFQSREDFRAAWLSHRKLARSCHDLDLLGQSPGWGQTQAVDTGVVCRLGSGGGAVRLPDTGISLHVPEGHVGPGETQQVSLRVLPDPPLELNSDRCSSVSPVVELRLGTLAVRTGLVLELRGSAEVKADAFSQSAVGLRCLRSAAKDGPYAPAPLSCSRGDTVQVQLDQLEPCMYLALVAHGPDILYPATVWDFIHKKVTVGVYGPKHIHPSFKTVVTLFGHDCAPKTLLVGEAARPAPGPAPVALQLWGKHQFALARPQDLQVCVFPSVSSYEVQAAAGAPARVVRGFQLKLGKASRLLFPIACRGAAEPADFTLCVQIKDEREAVLAQFCVRTPPPPPKSAVRPAGPRRFLKKNEVGKLVLSPLAAAARYPTFQDRPVGSLKLGKLLKTVTRQSKSHYLLEYRRGEVVALLSEERVRLRGQLWTKEWYIAYHQGRVGLVHAKNVLLLGRARPALLPGPELRTALLLEQLLRPCKFLTYIYASVRTRLMESVGSWRAFADALGYAHLPLTAFCRAELDSEPERVASVLEKLKEDCNSAENRERKSFQKELIMALLKMDCQGLVVRLIQDFVLLTTAVEVAQRWRELAEKLAKVSKQQMDAYESPHRDRNGVVDSEAMWKPAYDFLLTWSHQIGDSYRDVIQELHLGLDKMKNPITKRWKHLTGTLILVNSLDVLRAAAFSPADQDDFVI
ncbi:SH3 domain-binding protein 4 [Sorex araneus]|uniref:SH3 domain-binding protein 4 n=1 Tax=Sorex araneus TaxID=42254 RepID=UPI00243398A3|nr:SH3 domain-binding protein 4 [Sorex araneus]